jgi:hypothetical protein
VSDYRLDNRSSIPGRDNGLTSGFSVPTSSETHSASHPMSTGVSFPGIKAQPRHDADHSLHLVLRSRMNTSNTSSAPWCLYGCSGTALRLTFC